LLILQAARISCPSRFTATSFVTPLKLAWTIIRPGGYLCTIIFFAVNFISLSSLKASQYKDFKDSNQMLAE
jgi:hypothetical protein